ncbi:MAG: carboxypeptidase-like regulatory domain-containing protein [Verrucomicrobiota bacterium]
MILWIILSFLQLAKKPKLRWMGENGEKISPSSSGPSSHAEVDRGMTSFLNDFKRTIDLYGRVLDQNGKPIPGATITIYALDNPGPDASSSVSKLTSDANGNFSILGLKGFQLGVDAAKKGFIDYSPLGGPTSNATVGPKDHHKPEKRLILTLHDPGTMEPLIHTNESRRRFVADGTPKKIFLDSEDGKSGTHALECRFVTKRFQLPEKDFYSKRYDWSFEMRISGGGFVRNRSDLRDTANYQFEAPEAGYQETIRYDFPADQSSGEWKRALKDSFFVKFPDGTHGRIRFTLEGFTDRSPLLLETWWNPKPGPRNLASLYK